MIAAVNVLAKLQPERRQTVRRLLAVALRLLAPRLPAFRAVVGVFIIATMRHQLGCLCLPIARGG